MSGGSGTGAGLRAFDREGDPVQLLACSPPPAVGGEPVTSPEGCSLPGPRTESTGRTNRAITHGRFRSPGYVAASCGGALLTVLRTCIDQQSRSSDVCGFRAARSGWPA
ncbi:hypothetical protein Ppa06_27510 [Planomonospora parontospora subsp. parontospora]|uniref:Uncharacterized protein n=2 Tax=Planomonospora parontospora TaxID=58119 RepID=A0AA37F4U7_9ACTN|nr:hypothetical protein GCM10010126_30670 [Planomonospora parontospora]GII08953.1 hypothetical protein Ppa06_27510 [Planomonospora parontospora subsp. parontospora]